MGARDEAQPLAPYDPADAFAGDLFLALAAQGRLVLDTERADQVIADLEHTMNLVSARVRLLELWRRLSAPVLDDLDPDSERTLVDTVFADQLAPGRLEEAMRELPKYVEAIKAARRTEPVEDPGTG
jgi:hypothetical protein